MPQDNCLHYWCFKLKANETKPWHDRHNCGKIMKWIGIILMSILVIIGMAIVIILFGALLSVIFNAVEPVAPCNNLTSIRDYNGCVGRGGLAFIILMLTLIVNMPILGVPFGILYNKYIPNLQNKSLEIIYITLCIIFSVGCAIFAIPSLSNVFFPNSPCTLYECFMIISEPDLRTCQMRHFLVTLVIYGLVGLIAIIWWTCRSIKKCYQHTMEMQKLEEKQFTSDA